MTPARKGREVPLRQLPKLLYVANLSKGGLLIDALSLAPRHAMPAFAESDSTPTDMCYYDCAVMST